MPNLVVDVAHSLAQEEAAARMKSLLNDLKTQYADTINDLEETWDGHTGQFRFSVMGMPVTGTVTVSSSQAEIAGDLPLPALLFRDKIEFLIRDRTETLLA